jgi:cystathionine gamma-lyase
MRIETKGVHVGEGLGRTQNGDVVVPIHLASTFARKKVDEPTNGYEYSRAGNPTRDVLEERLGALENGAGGLAFASGLAAEATALFLLKSGDRVLVCSDLYGGTFRLFEKCFTQFGLRYTYIDFHDQELLEKELSAGLEMLWIETPTNPLLRVYDIKALAQAAHKKNPKALVVVDNTFASPYFQNPLDLGADLVVHSTTKYIGGHSDVIGGALISRDKEIHEKLRFFQKAVGATPSPFDSFLTLRGIKTLHLRMQRHQENALAVAQFLESHELVKKVNYPGLTSHPDHELAKRQMRGFSGMVSFELNDRADPVKLIESTHIFALAESLGGVESLIEHPASMTHASMSKEERGRCGLGDGLLRISVGIEHKDDLIEDLTQALNTARR